MSRIFSLHLARARLGASIDRRGAQSATPPLRHRSMTTEMNEGACRYTCDKRDEFPSFHGPPLDRSNPNTPLALKEDRCATQQIYPLEVGNGSG